MADVNVVSLKNKSVENSPHNSENDEGDVDQLENSTPVPESRDKTCKPQVADNQRGLLTHLNRDISGSDILSNNSKTTSNTKKIHQCLKCGVSFPSKHLMKFHFQVHGFGCLSCRFCRKVMINDAALQHHKCEKHCDERPCSISGEDQELESSSDHPQHVNTDNEKTSRSGNVTHTCSYCSRTFSRKVALFMHLKVHAGNKFVCLKCGQFLEDKDEYASHMTKHYAGARFRCQTCRTSFRQQRLYYSHMDNHQKYDCKDCPRFVYTFLKICFSFGQD